MENVMFDLIELIPAELGIMVVGLYLIGMYLRACNFLRNEFIPIVLCLIGILSSCLFLQSFTIQNIYFGIIASAVAVGINQVKVQVVKLKSNK